MAFGNYEKFPVLLFLASPEILSGFECAAVGKVNTWRRWRGFIDIAEARCGEQGFFKRSGVGDAHSPHKFNEVGVENSAVCPVLTLVAGFRVVLDTFVALDVDAIVRLHKIVYVVHSLVIEVGCFQKVGSVSSPTIGVQSRSRLETRDDARRQCGSRAVRDRNDKAS